MNALVENAAVAFMEVELGNIAAVDPIQFEVLPATRLGDVKKDRHVIMARVEGVDTPARVLRTVRLEIVVMTPAKVPGLTVEQMSTLQRVLSDEVWVEANAEELRSAVETEVDGWTSGGFYPRSWQPGTEATFFNPYMEITLGLTSEGV